MQRKKQTVSASFNLRYNINLMPFMWPNPLQKSLFVLALIPILKKTETDSIDSLLWVKAKPQSN